MHFSAHVTRVMSVVIRQIVFLTISASWCYSFESRDPAGSAPNNNITKARRLIISKNLISRGHQREPVSCSLPKPWAMILQHWLRNIQLLRTIFEHIFPARNLDKLPRSSKLAGLLESQFLGSVSTSCT